MVGPRAPVIAARGLRVRFGDIAALDGLDMVAPSGAITAVLGPNGAGKTTFVRAVATLQPYEGELEVAGVPVDRAPQQVRRRIGLAGQHAAVVERLTGRENLHLVARLYGQGPRQARSTAGRVIDELRLSEFAERRVATYSGGQRRRLDLGASLVADPELLLLDEPTAGLDPRSRNELWELVRALPAAGTSVLLTTQYLDEAQALADHVIIVDAGRVIASGSPTELRSATGTTSLTVTTDAPVPEHVAAAVASGLEAELAHRAEVVSLVGTFSFDAAAEAIRSADITPREVLFRPPALDDIFLSLTGTQSEALR